MDLQAAPITGLRMTGLMDPNQTQRLIAVEVLLTESQADGLRLGMQVAMFALVPADDDDGDDGPAG